MLSQYTNQNKKKEIVANTQAQFDKKVEEIFAEQWPDAETQLVTAGYGKEEIQTIKENLYADMKDTITREFHNNLQRIHELHQISKQLEKTSLRK